MDFTLNKYEQLLLTFQKAHYKFLTYEQYCLMSEEEKKTDDKFVILRHDVDKRAWCSLKTAQTEQQLGANASYYFRVVSESNQPDIIQKIKDLGHEIGYHYEDMSLCHGDAAKAKEHFEKWLNYFRKYYAVKTICMHGAPQSGWDSKDLWNTCNYRDFGIIGEPYFDTDFSDIFYLTDTGRRWDGYKVSVRDKIPQYQDQWTAKGRVYHSTNDIINALDSGTLPAHVMLTTHPQRWTNKPSVWIYELTRQSIVNIIKRLMIIYK